MKNLLILFAALAFVYGCSRIVKKQAPKAEWQFINYSNNYLCLHNNLNYPFHLHALKEGDRYCYKLKEYNLDACVDNIFSEDCDIRDACLEWRVCEDSCLAEVHCNPSSWVNQGGR